MKVTANLMLNQILVNEYSYKIIQGEVCAGCASTIIDTDDINFNEESYKDEFANTIRKMLDMSLGESEKFEFISGNGEILTVSIERKKFEESK